MYDLQAITVCELSLNPLLAWNDIEIQLDSYSVGLHSQVFDQATESDGPIDELIIAVDDKFHLR